MEGLGMEKVGVLFHTLEYITAIRYILSPFGNLVAVWYIFLRFGILNKEKSGNPWKEFGYEAMPGRWAGTWVHERTKEDMTKREFEGGYFFEGRYDGGDCFSIFLVLIWVTFL
jgi:hypothetical protein